MTWQPFDAEAVRALATILSDTGLTEIEVEAKDMRIRVARAHAPAQSHVTVPMAVATQAGSAQVAAPVAPPVAPVEEDLSRHPGAVLSPMVGVAYLAPEPGAASFVTVGQPVIAGQTLMLIEAMKTFNQIRAPKAGTVSRILIAAGAPVEYGEPLLILD